MLIGGCHCGSIRYEAPESTFNETSCHCSICRRTTGAAPHVAWFSVARAAFRFTQGSPVRYLSSAKGARTFCAQCGTQLTFEHADFAGEIDVTIGSLDDPDQVVPRDHIHTSSKLRWVKLTDGLPVFDEARNG